MIERKKDEEGVKYGRRWRDIVIEETERIRKMERSRQNDREFEIKREGELSKRMTEGWSDTERKKR